MTKTLKPPKVPDFGKYFDVHVTMAANPTNFTVQPFEDRVSLEVRQKAFVLRLEHDHLILSQL